MYFHCCCAVCEDLHQQTLHTKLLIHRSIKLTNAVRDHFLFVEYLASVIIDSFKLFNHLNTICKIYSLLLLQVIEKAMPVGINFFLSSMILCFVNGESNLHYTKSKLLYIWHLTFTYRHPESKYTHTHTHKNIQRHRPITPRCNRFFSLHMLTSFDVSNFVCFIIFSLNCIVFIINLFSYHSHLL